mmetsp:Transcript_6667/g.11198  ORF Transcript_6667/g.11198 Transcript_6667/m.11198 type:complete len:99 (+) Transcript_6667:216-512(+)
MGFHLPSFLVGSSIAGCGFLLIHRELSHRHRLTTKWALQEYAEKEWKEWRKSSLDTISDATKKNITQIPDPNEATTAFTSNWNRGISSLRGLLSQKKE